jgi:hypothetical protein
MKYNWPCLFLFVLCYHLSFGQEDENVSKKNPSFIGFSIDYGYILQHTSSLEEIGDAYPSGFSVDWSRFLLQKKAWDFCNCFPKLGVEMSYWNFGENNILGHGIAAIGYTEPYFRTKKQLNMFFRVGLGGVYLTKPFDEVTNPLNDTYSTNLSFVLMAGLGVSYRITDHWNLRLMAKYNHTSNGGINTPNRGINFPTLSLGVTKSFSAFAFPSYEKIGKREPPSDKTRISVSHFSGWSNTSAGGKDKFYVFGFSGKYSRWIGGRSAITGGTEIILDYSRRELVKEIGDGEEFIMAGALIGHEFWLGKVTFGQQLGIYYYNDFNIHDKLYQRYSLTYNFSKEFYAGFGLKAHRHVADFFDLRLGYRLN